MVAGIHRVRLDNAFLPGIGASSSTLNWAQGDFGLFALFAFLGLVLLALFRFAFFLFLCHMDHLLLGLPARDSALYEVPMGFPER
jgi:hypothetical protein